MITPVMPNMFMPSIMENNSVASVLQTAVDNSSLISMTVSEGGFTTEGLAFLAWLALLKDEEKELTLALMIETKYSSVMDYFEIFLNRMILCRKAAETLGLKLNLVINGQKIL